MMCITNVYYYPLVTTRFFFVFRFSPEIACRPGSLRISARACPRGPGADGNGGTEAGAGGRRALWHRFGRMCDAVTAGGLRLHSDFARRHFCRRQRRAAPRDRIGGTADIVRPPTSHHVVFFDVVAPRGTQGRGMADPRRTSQLSDQV